MSVFELSVIVLWVLLLVVVLLLWAVVRRLSAHEKVLGGISFAPPDLGPRVGGELPAVHAHLADGEHVDLGRDTVLACFSAHCGSCHEHAPELAALATAVRGKGLRPIALLDGDRTSAAGLLEALRDEVDVVLAPLGHSDVLPGLGISTFPAYLVVRDGLVVANAGTVPELAAALELPEPAAAP